MNHYGPEIEAEFADLSGHYSRDRSEYVNVIGAISESFGYIFVSLIFRGCRACRTFGSEQEKQ